VSEGHQCQIFVLFSRHTIRRLCQLLVGLVRAVIVGFDNAQIFLLDQGIVPLAEKLLR